MTSSSYATTHLRLLGMAALWGASWPWGRVVAQAMPPLAAACLRFVVASAVLLLWLRQRGQLGSLRALTPSQWWGLCAASAVGVFGYSACFLLALRTVPAGKAAMVVALNPVLTMLAAALLFRERASALRWGGLLLAVAGALYAITGGQLAALRPTSGSGEWLLLCCAGCWVSYTLIGKRVLAHVESLTATTVTALIGAGLLGVVSLLVEGPSAWGRLPQVPAVAWGSLLALATGAAALAYAWYLQGVKVLGAGAAAAYMALVPLFGLTISSLWLGEPLTSAVGVGAALAVAGMWLMNGGWLPGRGSRIT